MRHAEGDGVTRKAKIVRLILRLDRKHSDVWAALEAHNLEEYRRAGTLANRWYWRVDKLNLRKTDPDAWYAAMDAVFLRSREEA
jgi:hypothetical protein